MVDITHKNSTLRKAIATATVQVSKQETIDAVLQRKIPKGDVFEFARAAGLFGVKKTSDVIPDCHPLPVEYTSITFETQELNIIITVEVHTVYKTGVEVEAMHGASVAALTMYDMLKPVDKNVEIAHIKLVSKTGGKSGMKENAASLKCAVIVCSDTIAAGKGEDTSGKAIIEKLRQYGMETQVYEVVADEITLIREKAQQLTSDEFDLVLFTGGTGLSPRDVTPEALEPLIDIPVPGLMEAARSYGQARTPYAMLSRGVAGFIKDMLVITLPGSQKGAEESMDALFPAVLHVFKVRSGERH